MLSKEFASVRNGNKQKEKFEELTYYMRNFDMAPRKPTQNQIEAGLRVNENGFEE